MPPEPARAGDHQPTIEQVFSNYGWEITDAWKERYLNDPWVFNLTNALVNEHRRYLEVVANFERLRDVKEGVTDSGRTPQSASRDQGVQP